MDRLLRGWRSGRSTSLRWCLAAIALATACLQAPASAQIEPVRATVADLDAAAADVRAVDAALDRPVGAAARRDLGTRLADARKTASRTAGILQSQISLIDARITQLGPVTPGIAEAGDLTTQRRTLGQQRSIIDSAIRRGKLLGIEAAQLQDELDATIAAERGRTLAARSPSILTPAFWRPLLVAAPDDLHRVTRFALTGIATAGAGALGGTGWLALIGIALAAVLLGPVRLKLRAIGRQFAIDNVAGHRVRRSGFALWRTVIGTGTPALAALALKSGLDAARMVDARWQPVLDTLLPAICISAFVGALAGAILLRDQPSWRLLPIDDALARRLRPWTWGIAALALIDPLLQAINNAVRASPAAHVAADTAEAIGTLIVIGGMLVTIGGVRRDASAAGGDDGHDAGAAHPTVALLALLALATTLGATFAILLGYVQLSLWLMRAIVLWPAIVGGALYILLAVTDDIATSLFAAGSRPGLLIGRSIGIRPSAIDQFGVLLSGVLRVLLAVLGIGAVLTPFGTGLGSFVSQLDALSAGVTIGQVTIAPGAVLRAILVLGIGLALAKGFLRWLNRRYLPTTELDDSARNSVALVARYICILVAALWGLAALGIGLQRIALLLSALSVGIGFGLQAITQNFVSGLILLAERPVKIGDLVRIGSDEGDVKRISVRSTEIELADHSTLIVPNSKLITETVLNKTLTSPLGRVQIKFSVPLGTDPASVRTIVLEAFQDDAAILDVPAPAIFVDGIVDDRIVFNCLAHVAGPREVYRARSGILIQILQRFIAEGIEIGTPTPRMELVSAQAGGPAVDAELPGTAPVRGSPGKP